MSSKDPGLDASFDALRRAHRLERAPDALRRRVLERARSTRSVLKRPSPRARNWLLRPWLLGLAASVAAGVWFGISRLTVDAPGAAQSPPAHFDVVPSAEPAGTPATPARPCPKPLPTSPWNLSDDLGAAVTGLKVEVIETQTQGCGPLTRRYLARVPDGDVSSAPVLIVLHHAGESAEQAQISTRWWFDDLALRERVVLVYANGSQSVGRSERSWVNAGVWQTDEGAHPAVDDSEYLRGIVEQLRKKRGLAESAPVFLAGHGSGAVMALSAALRHPERYAGVAAFLPTRSPQKEDLDAAASADLRRSRLHAVFVALPDAAGTDASTIAVQWAAALGSEPGAIRVKRPQRGVQRVDSSLASGVALRILRFSPKADPFPLPGGGDPITSRASRARPFFFDGPGAAWAFFQRPNP